MISKSFLDDIFSDFDIIILILQSVSDLFDETDPDHDIPSEDAGDPITEAPQFGIKEQLQQDFKNSRAPVILDFLSKTQEASYPSIKEIKTLIF